MSNTVDKKSIIRTAEFNADRTHRFLLSRIWDEVSFDKPNLVVMGLNPSDASEYKNDMTATKCIEFGIRWNCVRLDIINCFTKISTLPQYLNKVDPRANNELMSDLWIQRVVRWTKSRNGLFVAAWGAYPYLNGRDREMVALVGDYPVWCLSKTASGAPRHPCRLGYDTKLEPFNAAAVDLDACYEACK